MKVIKPTTITSAILVSTTATETVAAWAAATAYVVGNQVLRTTTERIYQRLIAGTTATAPELDTTNWLDIGPSNRWAMFDSEISTQTSRSTSLSVVVKPGYVNALAMFGLEGSTATITVRDALAGSIVYGPISITLDGTVISDWYQYFFEPFVQMGSLALTDLPPYGNAYITVELAATGTVKCGILALGTVYDLGGTQFGASVRIIDYSRKDTDAFGVTTFIKRPYSKRITLRTMFDNNQLNKIQQVLADLRATPCAWIGTEVDGFEPLTVYGFYRDFSIDVAYATTSYCSIEIEGLAS